MKTTIDAFTDVVIRKHLAQLFTSRTIDGEERTVYDNKYLGAENGTLERYLYEIVSSVAFNSGLTHDFTYEIVPLACDVLAEEGLYAEDYSSAIDAIVPVYTNELMQLMAYNSWTVDDTVAEYGDQGTISQNVALTWYRLIDNAVHEIRGAIMSQLLIEEEL